LPAADRQEPTMTEIPAPQNVDATGATEPTWRTTVTSQQVVMRESGLFPWWTVLGLGILSVLLGIVVLAWPEATVRVMAALAGLWLVLGGLMRIFNAFVAGGGVGRQVLSGIVGVVLVLGGAFCLRNIVTTAALLALVVAVTWLLSGIAEMVMAFEATGGNRMWLIALGIVSLVIGLVFLITPELSLYTLVLTTGMGFIVTGAIQVVFGINLRRHRGEAEN
jgi:uncharacterized membrane protein HdeD (DUF308 family)